MPYAVITININEFLPRSIDFTNYGFIFSNDSKTYQEEITFNSKNQLLHKVYLNKRNMRFNIKVTKDGSLIGICDFIIPFYDVISNREPEYEKQCTVTMTETTRRLLFGGVASNGSIRLKVHAGLQYIETQKDLIEPKELKKNSSDSMIRKTMLDNEHSIYNTMMNKKSGIYNNSFYGYPINVSTNHKKINKTGSKSSTKSRTYHFENILNKSKKKPKNQIQYNMDVLQNYTSDNDGLDEIDITLIDEDAKEPVEKVDPEFLGFIDKFINENPLEKLDEIRDANEMQLYTKDVLSQLLDYQIKYYEQLKNNVKVNHRFHELLLKYNSKFRTIIKKQNKLRELENTHMIKDELTRNVNRADNREIKKILPIKNDEKSLLYKLYDIPVNESELKSQIEEMTKIQYEQKEQEEKTANLLAKVMNNVGENFGALTNYLNSNNSTEAEITNVISVMKKYYPEFGNSNTKVISSETNKSKNNGNFLNNNYFVVSEDFDENDTKLFKALNIFYAKKSYLPKIPFIKSEENTYNYGTQTVTAIFDNNSISIMGNNGQLALDKFIELNASIESAKVRINETKNALLNGAGVNEVNIPKFKTTKSKKADSKKNSKK